MALDPVPPGFHTVTPYMTIKNCAEAIAFYEKAFGAEVIRRQDMPSGLVMHATIKIGDSMVMMNDEFPEQGVLGPGADQRSPISVHLYVTDADAAFKKAIECGCTEVAPLMDCFWGERMGKVEDPFGFQWGISTQTEELTAEEVQKRGAEWMKQMADSGPSS